MLRLDEDELVRTGTELDEDSNELDTVVVEKLLELLESAGVVELDDDPAMLETEVACELLEVVDGTGAASAATFRSAQLPDGSPVSTTKKCRSSCEQNLDVPNVMVEPCIYQFRSRVGG